MNRIPEKAYHLPNGSKKYCRVSNNYLVNIARHLAYIFSRCLCIAVLKISKWQLFCKFWQYLTKALFRYLTKDISKTSQKCLRDTKQITKLLLRYLWDRSFANFCKSNKCLSKPLFRHIFGICLGSISDCPGINFCKIEGWFCLF